MNKPTAAFVRDKIAELTLQLNQARKDAELYERLRGAANLTRRIPLELEALTAKLSEIIADDAAAERRALASRVRNLRIETKGGPGGDVSLLQAHFTIRYERLAFDSRNNGNTWQAASCVGFLALEEAAYAYLTETRPDLIPPVIANLAPGNSREAFNRYLMALRRGHN